MSEVIGYQQIKKCRKNHTCFWCGEEISKGMPYVRWCCTDPMETIKAHPECRDAWNDAADGDYYETMPYEHERPQ